MKLKHQYIIIAALAGIATLLGFIGYMRNSAALSQLLFVLIFVGIIAGGFMILKLIRDRS